MKENLKKLVICLMVMGVLTLGIRAVRPTLARIDPPSSGNILQLLK